MSCSCNKRKVVTSSVAGTAQAVDEKQKQTGRAADLQGYGVITPSTIKKGVTASMSVAVPAGTAVSEALDLDLESCYECTKKHIARAMIFFEEYHTGYPDHMRNLTNSLATAEKAVRSAFFDKMSAMAHLDMAAGELLGNDIKQSTMNKEHVELANKIRHERLAIANDPLYKPDFKELLVAVELLEEKYATATTVIEDK